MMKGLHFSFIGTISRICKISSVRNNCSLPLPKHVSPKPQVDYTDLSAIAMKLYTAGIEAVSSKAMVEDALKFNTDKNILELHGNELVLKDLQPYHMSSSKVACAQYAINRNVHVLAVGKAVIGMCHSVEQILGDHIVSGLAFVKENSIEDLQAAGKGDLLPSSKFEFVFGSTDLMASGQSLGTAKRVLKMAESLQANDILLTLISGGGSALLTMPKPPLTLQDKVQCIELMKKHKVAYLDQNTVRKNLSLLKGGGLSAAASPAKVISLILSNLPHNLYTEVAGGLTTSDTSTPQQAMEILRKYRLVDQVPHAVLELLETEAQEANSVKRRLEGPIFTDSWEDKPKARHDTSNTVNILAGSDEIAVATILNRCVKYDIPAHAIEPKAISSSTKDSGRLFASLALYTSSLVTQNLHNQADRRLVGVEFDCIQLGMSKKELKKIATVANEARSMKRPLCLIFTSEIVVDLKEGSSGKGGRCQEVALATTLNLWEKSQHYDCLQECDVQLFSIDSDGIDGGNEVAGAIANCTQASQIICGKSAQQYLDDNDSYTFYANLEDGKYHVVTGATGIDIQNFQLLLIRNKSW